MTEAKLAIARADNIDSQPRADVTPRANSTYSVAFHGQPGTLTLMTKGLIYRPYEEGRKLQVNWNSVAKHQRNSAKHLLKLTSKQGKKSMLFDLKDRSELERIYLDVSNRRELVTSKANAAFPRRADNQEANNGVSRTVAPQPPGNLEEPALVDMVSTEVVMERKDFSSVHSDEEAKSKPEALPVVQAQLVVPLGSQDNISSTFPNAQIEIDRIDVECGRKAALSRRLPDTNTPEGRQLCFRIVVVMASTLLAIVLTLSLAFTIGGKNSDTPATMSGPQAPTVASNPPAVPGSTTSLETPATTPATETPAVVSNPSSVPGSTSSDTPVPSPDPGTTTPTLDIDLQEYTLKSLKDPQSAQAQAYAWMAASYDVSTLADMPGWRKQQIFALACIYYAFTFDTNWSASQRSDWLNPGIHECDWSSLKLTSISCKCLFDEMALRLDWPVPDCFANPDQRIKRISWMHDESSWALSGTFPHEIALLSSLESITITGLGWREQLDRALPPQIQNLGNLSAITFYRNELFGTIPTYLGAVTALRSLRLDSNKLSGSVPSQLGLLTNQSPGFGPLSLADNDLSGTMPDAVCKLTPEVVPYVDCMEVTCPCETCECSCLTPSTMGGSSNDLC